MKKPPLNIIEVVDFIEKDIEIVQSNSLIEA